MNATTETTTTKLNHTPGPWKTNELKHRGSDNSWFAHAVYAQGDTVFICSVDAPDHLKKMQVSAEGRHANARLIAQSPALLELAETILYDINGLNATLRDTDAKYAASPLCAALNDLVRRAAEIIHKTEEQKQP